MGGPPTPSLAPYPARLEIDAPLQVANWRPLVHWLLVIPHALIASALRSLRNVLTLVVFFTVLFTKQIPRALFDMMTMTHRYQWRVNTYFAFMREPYPPFDFQPSSDDPGTDRATLSIEYPAELNRWLPLVKWFLAIPHYIVLSVLFAAAVVAGLIAFFAVLFTGRWPGGLRTFIVGVARWSFRVKVYVGLLRDEYPPFSLSSRTLPRTGAASRRARRPRAHRTCTNGQEPDRWFMQDECH